MQSSPLRYRLNNYVQTHDFCERKRFWVIPHMSIESQTKKQENL